MDKGFNRPVKWDIPLLEGYKSIFVSRDADLEKPWSIRIPNVRNYLRQFNYDCILLLSYNRYFDFQIVREAPKLGIKVLMRAEFSDIGKRNPIKQFVRDRYLMWLYRQIDVFAVIGENAKQHLLKRGVPQEKMVSSPYAVDTDLLRNRKRDSKEINVVKRWGFPRTTSL